MKLSRRDFVHAGCVVAAVYARPAIARFPRGSSAASSNLNRVSLNVPGGGTGLLNIASTWYPVNNSSQPLSPALTDANGYPNTTLPGNYSGNLGFDQSYYGKYVIQYTGQASIGLLQCAIIYSGGASVASLVSSGGAGQGYVTANFGLTSAANPSVVFKFGGLVTSVSGGNGSLVTIQTTATLNFTGLPTGTNVTFNQGCSSNLVNGPNFDGSWTITNVDGTHFTLNNSTGVISPTVTGSGGVGTQTEAIIANNSMLYGGSFAFSGFTALVVCKQADLTDITNGLYYSSSFVAQLQALRGTPGGVGRAGQSWLRFMDCSQQGAVPGGFECDFSQRLTPTTQCWFPNNNGYRPGYLTPSSSNAITNGGSDNYTCADPSVSTISGGNYIDNAIVQGVVSATNSGVNPTLKVGTGAALPIFCPGAGIWTTVLAITGLPTSPGTDVLHFSFQASWLNGGTAVPVSYTTSNGSVTPPDTSINNLNDNLSTFFNSQSALTGAGIGFYNYSNGGLGPVVSAPTAQAGRLSVTYTSGTASFVPTVVPASTLTTGVISTFIYNYLLNGWIYLPQGINCSQPLESIVELCNRVGANLWDNTGFTKSAYITAKYQLFGDPTTGLTSGLRVGLEGWNETWNSGASPHGLMQLVGRCFGWTDSSNGSDGGYTGLRTLQYCAVASTAWTGKGRGASDIYMLQMSQSNNGVGSGFDLYQLQGQLFTTTNSFYANYGGLNGGSASDHSTSPNRPVDFPTVFIGFAPYWNNRYLGNNSFTNASQLTGTVAQSALLLQAANDYANGLTTTAFASLVNQFNRVGTAGPNTAAQDFVDMQGFYTQQEQIAAQFDAGRSIKVGIAHYEAGPSFGLGVDGNNGVNSYSNQASTLFPNDVLALTYQIGSGGTIGGTTFPGLNWNVSAYTISGTNTPSEMATMILQMLQGWKYDLNYSGTAANTGSYAAMIETSYYAALVATSGANRETHPGQYGYGASNWGMFWSNFNTHGNAYQNFNAMQTANT